MAKVVLFNQKTEQSSDENEDLKGSGSRQREGVFHSSIPHFDDLLILNPTHLLVDASSTSRLLGSKGEYIGHLSCSSVQ